MRVEFSYYQITVNSVALISLNHDKDEIGGHLTNRKIFYYIPALSKGTPKSVLMVQGFCCTASQKQGPKLHVTVKRIIESKLRQLLLA